MNFFKIYDIISPEWFSRKGINCLGINQHNCYTYIRKIIIHSDIMPSYNEINVKNDFDIINLHNPKNYTFSVIRSSRQYLGSPYGQCFEYRNSDSKSRQQCYRKCFRDNHQKTLQCIPLIIDYFISELDSIPNTTQICSKSYEKYEQKLRQNCSELCPKGCKKEEYSYRFTESVLRPNNDYWFRQRRYQRLYSKSIEWDSSEPMFVYSEEPVMSLSDYLVNCGGLMGLWFGTSAKDLITYLIESQLLRKLKRLFQ